MLLKKLDNLGSQEFDNKKALLNISQGDILLVRNPTILSENVYKELKSKISVIINKEPITNKLKKELSFLFIDAKNLSILEEEDFAIIKKEELEKQIRSKDLINKIVLEYQSNQA